VAYNLFVAYDLMQPGQNYEAVRARIKQLGRWHQLQFSLFYVHTDSPPRDAYAHVAAVLDPNDRLAVIEAVSAFISTGDNPPIDAINAVWFTP
jgi:hypothetical protein